MLEHTNGQAADQIDQQNQDARDGVAADEFGCTVHGTEEVRFLGQLGTAFLCCGLVDHTGVQIGVDRHLFARHGIQGETGVHFRHTAGTFGHHNKVNDHQNRKNDETHDIVTCDHKLAKGRYHLAGSFVAGMAIDQNHAGRGHVQGQAQHGGKQQDSREG